MKHLVNVGELRKALEGVDDSLPVLLAGGSDHSYDVVDGTRVCTVGKQGIRYYEWYGKENAGPGEKPVEALIFYGH